DGRYSGTLSVPLEKTIWSAVDGVAGMSGTFCDLEMRLFPELRGVVRTTWLGGIGAPSRRCLYMKSRDSITYRCSGMKRVWQAAPSMLKSATLVEAETETWSRCGPLIGATELLLMISMGPVGGTPLPLAKICASPCAFAAMEVTGTTAPIACESTAAKL